MVDKLVFFRAIGLVDGGRAKQSQEQRDLIRVNDGQHGGVLNTFPMGFVAAPNRSSRTFIIEYLHALYVGIWPAASTANKMIDRSW